MRCTFSLTPCGETDDCDSHVAHSIGASPAEDASPPHMNKLHAATSFERGGASPQDIDGFSTLGRGPPTVCCMG